MFSYEVGLVLGALAGLVLTIVLYITVMPRRLDGTFTSSAKQKLHDFFHFKKLYLEEVLKFFYVLATVATVCIGLFLLLSYREHYSWGYYDSYTTKESLFLYGLLTMVVGPIALRLVYEVSMMFILLVKNTIEINNKLSKPQAKPVEAPAAPTGTCPNCGKELKEGAAFCTSCGHKL